MKIHLKISVPTLVAFLISCSGSTSDPSTVAKSDLTPPYNLHTVTGDGKIELRWNAQNAEDDLQGYYVFGRTATTSANSTTNVKYPTTVTLTTTGIPRCKDNTTFFELFASSLKTDKECKAFDTDDTTSTTTSSGTSKLAADSTEVLTGWLNCDEDASNAKLSVESKTLPVLTTQKCTVSKIGGNSLVNGTKYEFFVVAVKGSSRNKISWTSNLVTDAPSKDILAEAAKSFAIASGYFRKISIDVTALTATVSTGTSGTLCTGAICTLNTDNSDTSTTPAIYLGRGTGTYPQRIFVSTTTDTSSGYTTKIQLRGNQTYDSTSTAKVTRAPGDEAASSFANVSAGTKYPIGSDTVVDFEITGTTSTYYGKLVLQTITLATATSSSSLATITASVIMQPTAGLKYYFSTGDLVSDVVSGLLK